MAQGAGLFDSAALYARANRGKMVDCVINTTERFMNRNVLYDIDALFEIDKEARESAKQFITK